MLRFSSAPPLGLYVHVPWCVRKCPYCDFNSYAAPGAIPEREYVAALLGDLERDLTLIRGRSVHSVYVGGGTPSLISPDAYGRLLDGVAARVDLRPDAEVTLEANPGTVEQGQLEGLRAAGVNRLSIGVQSFHPSHLAALGRIHGRAEAIGAVESAHAAGFDNVNVDLMYGLPGQTPAQARRDVATAIALSPTHVSYYQLALEPDTPFFRRPPCLPDDETMEAIEQAGQAQLTAAGYARYEVSAYAREGWQCRHNRNYWQFGDYLGIGAGAHSKLTRVAENQIERLWKKAHPREYLAGSIDEGCIEECSALSDADASFEFMMNALRLTEGFSVELFSERTGLALSVVDDALRDAERCGYVTRDRERIMPTPYGTRYLNALLELFVSSSA